jgi:hypothetical protein
MDSVPQDPINTLIQTRKRLEMEIAALRHQLETVNQSIQSHEFEIWLTANGLARLHPGQVLNSQVIQDYLIKEWIRTWGWESIAQFCSGVITILGIVWHQSEYSLDEASVVIRSSVMKETAIPYDVAHAASKGGE